MNIGILAPSVYMSPTVYGDMIFAPRDLVIALADGLTRQGHCVYFFSSPDTKTQATLIPGDMNLITNDYCIEKLQNIPGERAAWAAFYRRKRNYEGQLTARCFSMAAEGKLDIIHSYIDELAHFFSESSRFPTVYTLHDPLPSTPNDLTYWLLHTFSHHAYVSISDASRVHPDLHLSYVATVYHGIDSSTYPFSTDSDDYMLFMGRLVPDKGLHDAITSCIKENTQLFIGADFPDVLHESVYYQKFVKPHFTNPLIKKIGMLHGNKKNDVYKKAKALLFPIHWEEPFGMVMIESMASGTPVVAYARGSVPEVIVDGITGFIVNETDDDKRGDWIVKKTGVAGLVEAMKRLQAMSKEECALMRRACRKHVEEKFSIEQMVSGYERVYEKVLKE